MKLSVAYNWDINLLNKLSELNIYEIFASLDKSILGSGRGEIKTKKINFSNIKEHVTLAHKFGIKFNYLINSNILPKVSEQEIINYLNDLVESGVDIITIAHPKLISIAKKLDIKVNISTNAHITTINQILKTPYDYAIRLTPDVDLNRELTNLKNLSKNTDKELELLVNQGCIYKCSQRDKHNIVVSKLSQINNKDNQKCVECENELVTNCHNIRISEPYKLIESPWFRPEDLYEIEKFMGKEIIFKIAGRELGSDWIYRAAKAYSKGHYNGNIFDIIYIYNQNTFLKKNQFYLDSKFMPKTFVQDLIDKDQDKISQLEYYKKIAKSVNICDGE